MSRIGISRSKHRRFLHRVSQIVAVWSPSEQDKFWRSGSVSRTEPHVTAQTRAKRSKAVDVKQLRLPL